MFSWHHYCSTRNHGSTRVEQYMDGKMVKFGNTGGTKILKLGKLYFGTFGQAASGRANHFMHGSLCGFRLYTRVLTQKDISMLYNGGACF